MHGIYLLPSAPRTRQASGAATAPNGMGTSVRRITAPVGSGNGLTVKPRLYFTPSFVESATVDPVLEQSGNAKVDLRIGFGPRDGHWGTAIVGKTLTNGTTAQFRQAIALGAGSATSLVDPPRTSGLQFSLEP